jgi:hypothetical protein
MNPELFTLSQIDWQFFATFTFKSDKISDAVRVKMFFAWLRTQSEYGRVHFSQLLWFLRAERGEQTGRKHFHALISGLPNWMRNTDTCFSMMAAWEKHGGGMARIFLYDGALSGVEYSLKELETAARLHGVDKSNFEANKFGWNGELMMSKSIGTMLRAASDRTYGTEGTTQGGVSAQRDTVVTGEAITR